MSAGYYYLAFALIIPMAALCYMPLRAVMRYPLHVTAAFVVSVYALLCLVYRPLLTLSRGHIGALMPVILVLLFVAFTHNILLENVRAALIFCWSIGLITFASGFTQIYVLWASGNGVSVSGSPHTQIIRLCLAIAILAGGLFFSAHWKKDFLDSPAVPSVVWMAWLPVPILFIAMQTALLIFVSEFAKIRNGIAIYVLFIISLFILYVFLSEIFYTVADSYVTTARLRDEQELMELQKIEYKRLQEEMDETGRLRHDFRHSINLLATLAENKDIEGITDFVRQYRDSQRYMTVMNYCKNPAINAVLNHYAHQAREADVPLVLQVDLPDELPFSDPEICSLLGNLMENAIDACKLVPKENRRFSLSVLVQNDINLYIVSTNTYEGKIERVNDRFLSTKHENIGIGTRSIEEIAKKYNGYARFHYSESEFFVDILMSIG